MRGLGGQGVLLVPSPLSVRLEPGPGHHPDALRAFLAARRTFVAGERIDMGGLATVMGVDRTSLFRWVGNRDALLSEVLWSLAEPTLDAADAAAEGAGAARVVEVLTHFVDALIEAPYFREFLRREPARALRLLTTRASDVQRRYVAVTETLLRRAEDEGAATPGLTRSDLAFLLVRISESFTYADVIAGEEPSAVRARAAFELVLRP